MRPLWCMIMPTYKDRMRNFATLIKGMKELKLSGSITRSIYPGVMLVIDVLSRALLRVHGQPGMDWVLKS